MLCLPHTLNSVQTPAEFPHDTLITLYHAAASGPVLTATECITSPEAQAWQIPFFFSKSLQNICLKDLARPPKGLVQQISPPPVTICKPKPSPKVCQNRNAPCSTSVLPPSQATSCHMQPFNSHPAEAATARKHGEQAVLSARFTTK